MRSCLCLDRGSLSVTTLDAIVGQAIGRRYEEDFNHFHDHENWPGTVLLLIRLVLTVVFCWALHRSLTRESQMEVIAFQRQVAAA